MMENICLNPGCGNVAGKTKKGKMAKFCSLKCRGIGNSLLSREKAKETFFKKYGVDCALKIPKVIEDLKISNMEKYGYENPFSDLEIKKKIKATNLERYGAENPFASEVCKITIKESLIEKYGVDHPMKIDNIRDQIKATNLERYGVDHPLKNEDIKKKRIEKSLKKYGCGPRQVHLPKTVLLLLEDKELAIKLGANGKNKIFSNFSIERHLQKLNEIIQLSI